MTTPAAGSAAGTGANGAGAGAANGGSAAGAGAAGTGTTPNPFTGQGGQAGQGAGAGQQTSVKAPDGVYWPENIPEGWRGQTDKETIDKLYGAAVGFKTEADKRGKPPEKSDDYKLELAPDLQKVFGDLSKDAGVKVFKTVAHKHGLTVEQAAGLFSEYHQGIVAAGILRSIDVVAEAKKLAGQQAAGLGEEALKVEAGKRWQTAVDWVGGLEKAKVLTPDQAVMAKSLAETADGIMLLEALKNQSREHGLQPGAGGTSTTAPTREDLKRQMSDERYDSMSPKYDPAFRKRIDEQWAASFRT